MKRVVLPQTNYKMQNTNSFIQLSSCLDYFVISDNQCSSLDVPKKLLPDQNFNTSARYRNELQN